ncbi:MAG: hypothetical protein Ct9H90mP9_5750 [Pseudomonadota bacterium]|nr:MAG: hypothetical protein Ct9H90mP9_5750 [Pseudomonadota bacterium]
MEVMLADAPRYEILKHLGTRQDLVINGQSIPILNANLNEFTAHKIQVTLRRPLPSMGRLPLRRRF